MDLDRGVLTRIDRKLLAGLDRDARFQMVRVPVTPAKWATWKRYCTSVGISMGRAIAALIDDELASVLDDPSGATAPLPDELAQRGLAHRHADLSRREQELRAAEKRAREWNEGLRMREQNIAMRERRAKAASRTAPQPVPGGTKTGRNQRCPCGSGLKYKHCHGPPGWARHGAPR